MKRDAPYGGVLALLLVAVVLAGCARVGPPAAVRYGDYSHASRPSAVVVPPSYKVVRGDTVYDVSRRYRVPMKTIIRMNNLRAPYHLNVGQVLRLPAPRTHRVARGDTLYEISRRYDVDVSQLARVNGLKSPYIILPGQRLVLPGTIQAQVARSAPSGGQGARAPTTSRANTATDDPSPPRRTASRPAPPSIPDVPARASGRFLWPAEGELVARYGSAGKGLHNDGINIAMPEGTAIRAADNGVVVYAGNELKGFGNLLLIKHADGWMTAYGHLSTTLVKRGDTVARGQTIAKSGSSGGAPRPQLHFELRRGTKAVDPIDHLARA